MTPPFSIPETISLIRRKRPLILNITNLVAMDFSANALLAIGASPIMAIDQNEIEDLVSAADAVVINMGTLNQDWLKTASLACTSAKECKKPIIFDPVGAGATNLRTETARSFLSLYEPDVVRGNSSEILALFTEVQTAKGVDAGVNTDLVVPLIREQMRRRGSTFVISGATDHIVSPNATYFVKNGVPEMAQITAMGCVATCLIAAFHAVEPDSCLAALKAMAVMGICGEIAAAQSTGPGSLRVGFLDLLAQEGLTFDERINVGVA
jgi:hydroxyethylthiazole kinase